jgi:hypothetical protein
MTDDGYNLKWLVGLRFIAKASGPSDRMLFRDKEYDAGQVLSVEGNRCLVRFTMQGEIVGECQFDFPFEFNQTDWHFYLPSSPEYN